ncbi:MAG: hypothetical protein AB1716_05645 [Planctomycetota bacterium]
MTPKSLDAKLAKIKADPSSREFILADAKDADMAYGMAAPGRSPEMHAHEGRFRSLAEYHQCIRDVVRQGVVDIVLMSAHTNSLLTIEERLFENSHVTPAARANDTTDIHVARGSAYTGQPSLPFSTATIDHLQCGRYPCQPDERARGANLGLYSVTFNNDAETDRRTIEAYKAFRLEAEQKGFRHFLEVFDPNAPRTPIPPERIGGFINDMIARTLAGVPQSGRPLFLKMVYHGPRFTEELAHYDPTLVIGVLGGAAGTTYDAFKLVAEAQKYGARAALFGRKINNSEHQLAFIQMLRHITDGHVSPEEAVHAYHGVLQKLSIRPYRALNDDLKITDQWLAYVGTKTSVVVSGTRPATRGVERLHGVERPRCADPNRDREGAAPRRLSARLGGDATATAATAPAGSYAASAGDGNGRMPNRPAQPGEKTEQPREAGRARPDFANMTSAERLAYHRKRLGGGNR